MNRRKEGRKGERKEGREGKKERRRTNQVTSFVIATGVLPGISLTSQQRACMFSKRK